MFIFILFFERRAHVYFIHAILMFPFFLLELSVFFFNIAVFYLQLATADLKSALQVCLW